MTKHLRLFMLTLLTIVCTVGGYSQTWEKVSLTDLTTDDVFVIVGTISNKTYALPNTETNKKPAAVAITISTDGNQITGDVTDNLKWNIEKSEEKYTFYPNGNKKAWLYSSSTSTNLGIGSTGTNKTFKYVAISSKQYEGLLNTSTNRYICIYSNNDWRAYANNNITATKISYYKYTTSSTSSATTTTFGTNSGKTFTFTNGKLEGFTTPTATATKSDDNTDLSDLIEYASSDADIVTVDSKTGELTFTNTKFGEATITATLPKTDTYQTSTDSYVVENKNKDNHIATSLSFNGTDITLTEGKTDAGTDFTGYTATEASNIAGTITYAASGDAVATVNPTTGAVTINATTYGTTTITATFTPADPTQYSGSTATYQITNKKAVDLSEIVFDVSEDKVSGTGKLTLTKSIVKINTSSGALGKYTDYRFYSGSKTTFSLTDPTRVITSIKFVGGSAYGNFTTDKPNYDKTTGTWTGYEESVKFTAGSKVDDVTQIIVTTAEKKTAPALSFAEATVTKELKEEIIGVQALTKPEDLDASAITYTSSDKETAEVSDGMIYMYKTGEATITATSAATDKYAAGTASYKLIISDSRKDAALAVKENPVKVKLGDDIYDLASNITCDNGLNSKTFKYTSSDNSYTIVDNLIQISKIGTTTITAKFGGNDSYKPAEISYTFEVEDPRTTDADFKFAAESYNADLAEATDGIVTFNAANVLQNPNNLKVTYTISPKDENVDIDAPTGDVIISKRGTYTITATGAATGTYKETTATCTLKVINSAVEETSIEFVAGVDKGKNSTSTTGDAVEKGCVMISSNKAALGRDADYRFYNSTHTISTKIGKITKIEFIGNDIDYPLTNLISADNNYTYTGQLYGVWVGSAKEVVFTNGKQVRATNIIVTVEVPKAKNYTLDETKTDNVIETYENANVTLQRTLSKDYWNTFCVPFALDAEQVTQYFGEGTQLRTYEGNCNNNIVYFATVDNIEAGKPYIMKPGNTVVQNPTFEGVSMVATGLDKNGNPQAVGDASTVQMKGIYNKILLNTDKTELFLGDNDLFYYPIDDIDARTIGGLHAYFIVPQGTDIKKLRANLDGTPTSLDTIFDTEESNAPVYNLQGQCVGNSLRALKSGIYIQNGKKVVVK
ncbi:hypothetical protein [Leyella stercorea]|uniref:hypothetical protein n=1 Tax=Leyella stercorea TaxID=363265 RepID=UPI00266F7796|nr:hypothetical protein [Leyella stercorea]